MDAIGELEPTLRRLKEDHYDAVLCDMTADIIARSIGLNTIFISSGLDSIRQALDKAVALCRSQKRLRDENALFRALLSGQDTQVAVFDQERELAFFQGGDRSPEFLSLLRRELDELPEGRSAGSPAASAGPCTTSVSAPFQRTGRTPRSIFPPAGPPPAKTRRGSAASPGRRRSAGPSAASSTFRTCTISPRRGWRSWPPAWPLCSSPGRRASA